MSRPTFKSGTARAVPLRYVPRPLDDIFPKEKNFFYHYPAGTVNATSDMLYVMILTKYIEAFQFVEGQCKTVVI